MTTKKKTTPKKITKKKTSSKKKANKKVTRKKTIKKKVVTKETGKSNLRLLSKNDSVHSDSQRGFVDKDRDVMEHYYDTMELGFEDIEHAESSLTSLIRLDPYFLDPYLVLYEMFEEEGDFEIADKYLDDAFRFALELILDAAGDWPDKLEWGWLENRHILRTLHNKALALWVKREKTMSLYLFKKILKMNPGDNSGARYPVLGILLGMEREEFEEFSIAENGYMNPEIDDWFEKYAIKYPEILAEYLD